jgi:hypothetical protein
MRRILIDHARALQADKRGGPRVKLTLGAVNGWAGPQEQEDLLAIHEALEQLSSLDRRAAQVVELRFRRLTGERGR